MMPSARTAPRFPRRQPAAPHSFRVSPEVVDEQVSFGPAPFLNRQAYEPGERQVIPADGAWVMVIRPLPPIAGGIDDHVRPGRVFWAVRDPSADADGFTPDGTYLVVLDTPWGEVKLFPHEYARQAPDFLTGCWQAGELEFFPLHIDAARLNDVVFYAQSRGVPLADAAVMALGTLSGNVGYFVPAPEHVADIEALAGAGIGYGLQAKNVRRRAEARARKHSRPTVRPN